MLNGKTPQKTVKNGKEEKYSGFLDMLRKLTGSIEGPEDWSEKINESFYQNKTKVTQNDK
ncbi:hypothetical protein IT568_00575 [bacterium]|nr:hypothetical protein [bacterium]